MSISPHHRLSRDSSSCFNSFQVSFLKCDTQTFQSIILHIWLSIASVFKFHDLGRSSFLILNHDTILRILISILSRRMWEALTRIWMLILHAISSFQQLLCFPNDGREKKACDWKGLKNSKLTFAMKSIYKKNHKFYLATFKVAYFETSFKQKMSSVIEYYFSWKLLLYQRSINMDELSHLSGVFLQDRRVQGFAFQGIIINAIIRVRNSLG